MFYKTEVEKFQFYKMPKWLFEEPYSELSSNAKLMYMMMFDRLALSIKNKWYDENERLYIYFTIEQFKDKLNISRQTVINCKKELIQHNLLEEVRQGFNKPNLLYITGLHITGLPEVENLDHGSQESRFLEVENLDAIKTNITKTNILRLNNQDCPRQKTTTNPIYSIAEQEFGRLLSPSENELISKWLSQSDYAYSQDLIKKAIELTRLAGKTNLKYAGGILRNWHDNNITTVEQVEVEEKAKSKKKEEATEYDDIF